MSSSKPEESIGLESTLRNPRTVEYEKNSETAAWKHAEASSSAENVAQGFGPSISAWEKLKKTNRTHIIIASVIAVVIGIILGAGITAIIFTQTSNTKKDEPSPLSATVAIATTEITVAQSSSTVDLNYEFTTDGTSKANCDVEYKGKCFRAIVNGNFSLHFNRSKLICEKAGMQLANIYSGSHYFMIEGYLRSKFPLSGFVSTWTAMKMIPEDHQIVLSTGENITLRHARWHHGFPSDDENFTRVGIEVLRLPTNDTVDLQGLWNFNPSWTVNSALCEEL